MFKFLCVIAIFVISHSVAFAQRPAVVFKTGAGDVACAGGVCLVPTDDGYSLRSYYGFRNGVAIIPQSTAFFALSNPQVFEFRVRNFSSSYGSDLVTFDDRGNQVLINSGIQSQTFTRSRGQILFSPR